MVTPCEFCGRSEGSIAGPGLRCPVCRRALGIADDSTFISSPYTRSTLRADCRHLGTDTGDRIKCVPCGGGVSLKVMACKVHGKCTVGKPADGLACCATCPSHEPKASQSVWRETPPITLPTRRRKRAVVTVAIGPAGKELHDLTGPSQRAFAAKFDADYIVIDNPTQTLPCFEKFRVKRVVEAYPGGTLYLDADVFVLPDCPNIFRAQHCPSDRFGVVDVLPRMHTGFRPHVLHEVTALCQSQGVPVPPGMNDVYWNSGVWIGRPDHAGYWTPPSRPVPGKWCDEENWCRRTAFAKAIPFHHLDPRFNWTWAEDREFRSWTTRRPWIVHLAGMGSDVTGWKQSNRQWRSALLRLLSTLY